MEKNLLLDLFTVEFESKYFGNITLYFENYICYHAEVKYNGNVVEFVFWKNEPAAENDLEIMLSLIDEYEEIDKIIKNIVKNYPEDYVKITGSYDIQYIKTKIYNRFPCLYFDMDFNDPYINIYYYFTDKKEYPSEVFKVKMDQDLNIKELKYEIAIKD